MDKNCSAYFVVLRLCWSAIIRRFQSSVDLLMKGCKTFMMGPSFNLLFQKLYFIYKMRAFCHSVLTIRSSHVFLRLLHFSGIYVIQSYMSEYIILSVKYRISLYFHPFSKITKLEMSKRSIQSFKTLNYIYYPGFREGHALYKFSICIRARTATLLSYPRSLRNLAHERLYQTKAHFCFALLLRPEDPS